MTKNFCDLCGKPAMEYAPKLCVTFPEQVWRGVKSMPGSISPTDGTWMPHIDARVVFEAVDFPNSVRGFNPDLCRDCMAKMLTEMATELKPK